jgi:hypothetical protein
MQYMVAGHPVVSMWRRVQSPAGAMAGDTGRCVVEQDAGTSIKSRERRDVAAQEALHAT